MSQVYAHDPSTTHTCVQPLRVCISQTTNDIRPYVLPWDMCLHVVVAVVVVVVVVPVAVVVPPSRLLVTCAQQAEQLFGRCLPLYEVHRCEMGGPPLNMNGQEASESEGRDATSANPRNLSIRRRIETIREYHRRKGPRRKGQEENRSLLLRHPTCTRVHPTTESRIQHTNSYTMGSGVVHHLNLVPLPPRFDRT